MERLISPLRLVPETRPTTPVVTVRKDATDPTFPKMVGLADSISDPIFRAIEEMEMIRGGR